MERPISQGELEASVVRLCAPVLLGAKPGNLFTFCGCFALDCPDCLDEACRVSATKAGEQRRISVRRARLREIVSKLDARLSPHGARCRVLAWRPFGALVYVFRPVLVARHLSDNSVAQDLLGLGYPRGVTRHLAGPRVRRAHYAPTENDERLEGFLSRLVARFEEQALPHEIGYFLGYPASDVRGFIEHGGRDFLCCGCWKVYADVRGAQRRFARYKRCTRRALRLYEAGASLTDLAGDPARLRAA